MSETYASRNALFVTETRRLIATGLKLHELEHALEAGHWRQLRAQAAALVRQAFDNHWNTRGILRHSWLIERGCVGPIHRKKRTEALWQKN